MGPLAADSLLLPAGRIYLGANEIGGYLIGCINVLLLRGKVGEDGQPQLISRWHSGNGVRLGLLAVTEIIGACVFPLQERARAGPGSGVGRLRHGIRRHKLYTRLIDPQGGTVDYVPAITELIRSSRCSLGSVASHAAGHWEPGLDALC